MKKIMILLVFCVLGYQIYSDIKKPKISQPSSSQPESNQSSVFKCDGRTYCSQMTSCTEATFFINNCPNTKMDGNNDGIPCEKQWCN